MPYLELSLRCSEAEQPRYEHALEDVGALAVTLLDADAETPNERAILEPGVGEMPIWGDVALSAPWGLAGRTVVAAARSAKYFASCSGRSRSFEIRRGSGICSQSTYRRARGFRV